MAVHTLSRNAVIAGGQITWVKTLGMLAARTVLFAFFQLLIALVYLAGGSASAWDASIPWWPVTAILANFVCIALLERLAHGEGLRLRDIYRGGTGRFPRDLWVTLGLFLLVVPIAWLPNLGVATWLFGDSMIPVRMMFLPLPDWALYASMVLFPITIGLAELPVYMGYVLPRLTALTNNRWLAVLVTGLALSLQHMMLPLVLDGRFIAWRMLMFLPFALFVAICLRWRPSMLPYWMVGHALIDFGTIMTVFMASRGQL